MHTELEQAVERLSILKGKLEKGRASILPSIILREGEDKPEVSYTVFLTSNDQRVWSGYGQSVMDLTEQAEEAVAMRLLGESHETAAVESLGAGLEAVQ